MKRTAAAAVLIALSSLPVSAAGRGDSTSPLAPVAESTKHLTNWKWSLVPFAASQALDASSSWGMGELNPVLAGPGRQFDARAATLKLGLAGAFVGIEYLIVRKFPRSAGAFSKLNWSSSAVTTGFAIHNFTVR